LLYEEIGVRTCCSKRENLRFTTITEIIDKKQNKDPSNERQTLLILAVEFETAINILKLFFYLPASELTVSIYK
jgi:hypothetical protein